jgi:hypothetical protein
MAAMTTHKRNQRHATSPSRTYPWPLLLIAAPAAIAVWSGWVGLGSMCGFGPVNLLPGVGGGFHLNTAITLPVGVESYGTYALFAWLAMKDLGDRTRDFARKSAIGALVLGCLGQIAYHLMAASGWTRAPWFVVMLVSCLPVVTVYFAATLTHLILGDCRAVASAAEVTTDEAVEVILAVTPDATPAATPEVTLAPPVQVTPEPVSGQVPEVTSSEVSGPPAVTVPAAPQVRARRKVAARPPRISDADLKREVKAEFDADPSVSVNAAAKNLNRSRDRVRPLLEQVRREAHVSPIAARRQS